LGHQADLLHLIGDILGRHVIFRGARFAAFQPVAGQERHIGFDIRGGLIRLGHDGAQQQR
jgi:hypothetical protein